MNAPYYTWTSTTTFTIIRETPERAANDGDDLCHIVCCHDDNRGVCGADLAADAWCGHEDDCDRECLVCRDLQNAEDCLPEEVCTCPCCVPVPVEATA